MTFRARGVAAAASGICAAALFAGCGGDGAAAERDPFVALEREFERAPREERAAPRWEPVAELSGRGAATEPVAIGDEAIQWRLRWRCSAGDIEISVSPAPRASEPVASECPDRGSQELIGSGTHRVAVRATGPWRVRVDQQVQTPLREPPLPAMSGDGARVVAEGAFAEIERPTRGRAIVHRLASGRLALRLEGFHTSATTDLFVWLSRAHRPRTTRQALRAPHREIAPLKATAGDQNYLLPAGTDLARARSVVIWCEPVRIAYAVAPLRRPR